MRQIPPAILDQLAEGGRLVTVLAGPPGALGVAQLVVKEGGVTSGRPLVRRRNAGPAGLRATGSLHLLSRRWYSSDSNEGND